MRRLMLATVLAPALVASIAFAGTSRAASRSHLARWTPLMSVPGILDLSDPLPGGRVVVDQTTRLSIMIPGRRPVGFDPGYVSPGGDEPYMVVSAGVPRGCSFGPDTTYLLRLVGTAGVTAIRRSGRVTQFASIPVGLGFESGIAFDRTGHFGYRLLVTVSQGIEGALYAVDCRGRVTPLALHMPKVEGGLAVAPAGFGVFGGWLFGADEYSGHVYGIPPDGLAQALATLGPTGTDTGPESVGFVPRGFGAGWKALIADRVNPAYPPPGDDVILAIDGRRLLAAGVRPGDLLVATESGGHTFALRCRSTCRVRHVADGPATAHIEGHLVFVR